MYLSNCQQLQQLPDSISTLSRLVRLDVSQCTSLTQLPNSIGSMSSLILLDTSGCMALQQLHSIGRLFSFQKLVIKGARGADTAVVAALPGAASSESEAPAALLRAAGSRSGLAATALLGAAIGLLVCLLWLARHHA